MRKFLDKHVPSTDAAVPLDDQLLRRPKNCWPKAIPETAIEKLEAAVAADPANDTARYEYLRALLEDGQVEAAMAAYAPAANRPLPDARLVAIGHWLEAIKVAATGRAPDALAAAIAADKRDFGARFELAQTHFAEREFVEAMDELLEILMRDKTWREDSARKLYVAALQLLQPRSADDPRSAGQASIATGVIATTGATTPERSVVDAYRRRLSMVLF